jgi:hypothetical protein
VIALAAALVLALALQQGLGRREAAATPGSLAGLLGGAERVAGRRARRGRRAAPQGQVGCEKAVSCPEGQVGCEQAAGCPEGQVGCEKAVSCPEGQVGCERRLAAPRDRSGASRL